MIRDFLAARKTRAGTSALVRMPTGTGKSGVIAVAAHNLVETGDVLLLTPWDALVTQLADDVRRRFWKRIGAQPPTGKSIHRLYPSTARQSLQEYGPGTIWTATIATLQQLFNGYQADYRSLADRVRLVVVDEGHYEPALVWAKAVRGLNRPTVLFTATPYRNDLKYFNVDRHRHSYQYSHAEAESDHYLRTVQFETHDFDSPESFCDALLTAVDRRLGDGPGSKVIVRCQSQNSVQRITMELKARQRSVVGIHERFQAGDQGNVLRRHVPKDPEAEPSQFWVHQHKLTEGIDAAQFKMVAFCEPFASERAFVQQVGRVLRNPGRDPGSVAWVFSSPAARLEATWDTYRSYDTSTKNIGLPASPRKFARQQLVTQYFDGRFRTTFDLDAPDLHLEFLYPLSVRVYDTRVPLDLNAVAESVDAALEESDCEVGPVTAPMLGMRVHPYIAVRNSPLLARSVFTEFEVGFTVYRQVGRYLFYYDTQGIVAAPVSLLTQVDPDRLRRLYSGSAARLTSVSTINSDLGPHSPRRRSLQARSVDELGPDLSNHTHLAATVTGRTAYRDRDGGLDAKRENQTRHRYVGFTKSRIRDGGMLEFKDYVSWLDSLASSLDDQATRPLPVFDRYAEVIGQPADVKPANILLDIPSNLFETIRDDGVQEWLDIEDLCMDVRDGTFRCVANDAEYPVSIAWDGTRNRYNLSCPDLDERFSTVNAIAVPRARTLISYLNDEQAFRVIPASAGSDYCMYTGRLFCRPRLPLGGRAATASLDLLELISGVDALSAIKSEKGERGSATGAGWAAGSLFHLIDTLGAGTGLAGELQGVDLLVCDDMGTESADFLALDSAGGRAIAMHLKAWPTAKRISASALHEVSSQALKNLGYLQPYVREAPKNVGRWSGRWDGGAVGRVDHRIRKGAQGTTGSKAWRQFLSALRDPKTSREVWLVLGQGPPKSLLVTECRKRTPTAELIQMLYSLQSTWTSVASLGARLRVFSAS
jgi:superfamily II DNA or RNA helicase